MRKTLIATTALLLTTAGVAAAQGSTTQDISAEVPVVNEISVAAPSVALVVGTPSAGQALATATAASTYSITTNGTGKKITASLNSDMPAGLTLSATMAAPANATSTGAKVLSQLTAQDLVTGITQVSESLLTITYELAATLTAATGASSRTVTFTIADGV